MDELMNDVFFFMYYVRIVQPVLRERGARIQFP